MAVCNVASDLAVHSGPKEILLDRANCVMSFRMSGEWVVMILPYGLTSERNGNANLSMSSFGTKFLKSLFVEQIVVKELFLWLILWPCLYSLNR